jgi:transcriptional regulator with XRE-family HTH domain
MDVVRRQEIRRFLMARRAAIAPDAVGLPGGLRRRTPGLRREEVATLAGIGVTWYTWFEQGRDIQVSPRVLESVARALRLSASDADYLFSLSGVHRPESSGVSSVETCIQQTLDGFQSGPAMFFSPHIDLLAYNRLADLVFKFEDYTGPYARNHIWRMFMDPKRRASYLDVEVLDEVAVRWMRSVHGKMPDNAYFNELVRALCEGSAEFKRLWEAQLTSPPLDTLHVGMKLPRHGAVYFTSVRFRAVNSQDVLTLLIPTDDKTAKVMRDLCEI